MVHPVPRGEHKYARSTYYQLGRGLARLYQHRQSIVGGASALAGAGLAQAGSRLAEQYAARAAPGNIAQPIVARGRSKARRRRRPRIKNNKKLSKDVAQIKKQVSDLRHSENAGLALLTYRLRTATAGSCNDNEQVVITRQVNRINDYETVLGQLLYYNPSDPANLVTADGTTGTFQKQFLFKSISSTIICRNNYQTDADVIIYCAMPKQDTDQAPTTAWDNGIADDAGNTVAQTDFGILPTDFDTSRDLYNFKRMCSKRLSPGQSVKVNKSVHNIDYDPAYVDSHNLTYQKGLKNFGWIIIVKGTIGHDTAVAGEQGMMQAGVDVFQKTVYKVSYDAGVNMSYVYTDNTGFDTFTNGAVQSHQPVSDNKPYSRA